MRMVKVIGSVTSTIKDDSIKGVKLLFVQTVDIDLTERRDFYIAIDTVGLGEGELGLMVTGSTAKRTDITKDRNVDAAIVAKVERIDRERTGPTSFQWITVCSMRVFKETPADPKSNLMLTPTNVCESVILDGEDYGLKASIAIHPQQERSIIHQSPSSLHRRAGRNGGICLKRGNWCAMS